MSVFPTPDTAVADVQRPLAIFHAAAKPDTCALTLCEFVSCSGDVFAA